MKYISRILFTVGLVLGLTACTEDAFETSVPKLPSNGEMSVNLTFAMPDAEAQTRSKVSGEEPRVHTMQLVCFDANGLYLGIRNAEVKPDAGPTPDTGKIIGTVPEGTSRIHFIANRNLNVPLSFSVGTSEEEVMLSEELSTLYNENTYKAEGEVKAHQEVCYWGYHMAEKATDMNAWLNPKSTDGSTPPTSIVYMIRDRAKIVLTYNPTGASVPVTKIEWLIHNGRERGYLAPKKDNWTNNGYHGDNTIEDPETGEPKTYHISTADINEYTECGRYSLWRSSTDNDDENFDVAYQSTGTYTSQPQFLFDDDNEAIDDLKVILKVTYTVNGSPKTVYHVLKLNHTVKETVDEQEIEKKVLYDVVRNNTYYINAKLLSPDVAYYESLEDAVKGTEYMNADVEVDRSIPDINDDTYTLQIKLPTETTSIVFNTVDTYNLDFVFRKVSDINLPGSTNTEDFDVYWEKSQTFCTDPTLTYVEASKQFQIHTTVIAGQLDEIIKDETIVVKHKASGLTRYIHVYAINQFKFFGEGGQPTLNKVDGTTDDYVLSFKIPPLEASGDDDLKRMYPAGLYPIDVMFATSTLKAWSIDGENEAYGSFGVAVGSTSTYTDKGIKTSFNLFDNSGFESAEYRQVSSYANTAKPDWWYQPYDESTKTGYWDYWYTYSIKEYPSATDGVVNIYFKDVTGNLKFTDTHRNVGLYLYIRYFGKIYAMTVNK